MFKKISVLIGFLLAANICLSQGNTLNAYKYVIVPVSYEFSKEPDQYQLNSLSKFLFNKYGFIAIMDDEPLPQDLINNGCLALQADVLKDPGVFKTKLQIQLKNCRKEVVFLSQVGESREKKYHVAYNLALRQAFESFITLNYRYEPAKDVEVVANPPKTNMVVALPPNSENASNSVLDSGDDLDDDNIEIGANDAEVLYAQAINNGYQLVDSTPKVVYVLIFSGKKDFYMVKGKDATVYKLNDQWVIAETIGEDLRVKALNIKF